MIPEELDVFETRLNFHIQLCKTSIVASPDWYSDILKAILCENFPFQIFSDVKQPKLEMNWRGSYTKPSPSC